MSKIYSVPLGALIVLIAYVSSTVAASAMPPPPEPVVEGGAAAAPMHMHTTVVHEYVSVWTYALVAATAVAATLLVVALVRKATTARPASQWAR